MGTVWYKEWPTSKEGTEKWCSWTSSLRNYWSRESNLILCSSSASLQSVPVSLLKCFFEVLSKLQLYGSKMKKNNSFRLLRFLVSFVQASQTLDTKSETKIFKKPLRLQMWWQKKVLVSFSKDWKKYQIWPKAVIKSSKVYCVSERTSDVKDEDRYRGSTIN